MSWLLTKICHKCYQEENNIEHMVLNENTFCDEHRKTIFEMGEVK